MDSFLPYRWWKAHEVERLWPEIMLKKQEPYCVAACSRFREMNFASDHAWVLSRDGQTVAALLLHSQSSLFPVFDGRRDFYIPSFLYRFLKNIDIRALHGLAGETETLEKILEPIGLFAEERRDYNLMALDDGFRAGGIEIPAGLRLRKPCLADLDQMTPLQECYQKEEVLRKPADFDRRVCRLGLRQTIEKENALVAEMDGRIVGKINTNARAYKRCQIGGVYVLPAYRGRGVAGAMTAAFVRMLAANGDGVSLFVKKSNNAAEAVYRRCGFRALADYRIVYMAGHG